jgi:hypothetical protein
MSWLITGAEKTPVDPQFGSVSLLLHGNGTNGSTTITDNSPSPKTVTAVGNAQISTAQSKFGGASIAFDGSGDYLTTPDLDSFYYPADFTIEFWYRFSSVPSGSDQYFYSQRVDGNNFFFITATSTQIVFSALDVESSQILASTTHNNSSWVHLALVRNGNTITIYKDGLSIGSTTKTIAFSNLAAPVDIGRWSGNGLFFNGYIDDLRITKGVARYTSNFSVPPAQFPDI